MEYINQMNLKELIDLYNKLLVIKEKLTNNERLIITLDTETTGKYYNKFQIENTSETIVDKIIEIGGIFSIEEIDFKGFKKVKPILDENNLDLGFRLFFNPFIDEHKPFHLTMPDKAYEVHNISLEFLLGEAEMTISNEKLANPAPSIMKEYIIDELDVDNLQKSYYIKEIMNIINVCDLLIAHNAPFDVGMINEAVNDFNKLNPNDPIKFIGCEILDTLSMFRNKFPSEKLIAMQENNKPVQINHKLDYMMHLTGINERNVHGAYWDSKLLIDSYSILLEKYLTIEFKENIVNKQSHYLSKLNINDSNNNKIIPLSIQINSLFRKYLINLNDLNFDLVKEHLILQIDNINKKKRNIIVVEQIDISILYYKIFVLLNNEFDSIQNFEEKLDKLKNKKFKNIIDEAKKTKYFSKEEIESFSSLNTYEMSNYLTQAVYFYFKNKFNKEILYPLIEKEFNKINDIDTIDSFDISNEQIYTYFRTDGSIATKDNSLTTVIGSISNFKEFFKREVNKGNYNIICMDFNSIVNYIRVEKDLKSFNTDRDNKLNINYGLTTLLKINIDNLILDFEINIIAKNYNGIKKLPQIIANAYKDKYFEEDSYKDPYITLDYFKLLNNDNDLFVTLGSYQGLIEKIIFNTYEIDSISLLVKALNVFKDEQINIEIYNSDKFLLNYKLNIKENFNNINLVFTNPNIYLEEDYEYHKVRCYKYNDKIYELNNNNIFKNFVLNNNINNNFNLINLEYCTKFPQDPVNIPALIEDLEFIKNKRVPLYEELKILKDENGNFYNLDDNSKDNVSKIQKRYFITNAYIGLEKRFKENKISKKAQEFYLKRLEFELQIICDMKFDGYTLLVSDFLKTLSVDIGGLIGPGRGSAAGSLVSWAYWITNVDPMLEYMFPEKHLLFERYLNPERISLPDIDMDMNGLVPKITLLNKLKNKLNSLDINDTIKEFLNIINKKYIDDDFIEGKSLIEDYQVALYGADKVAKIVTRDTYQAKSAIAAVCRFLGDEFAENSGFKLKGTPYLELATRISGNAFGKPGVGFKDVFDPNNKFYNSYLVNLYYSNASVKKVIDLAKKLEGTIANYGVHAAGVLILDPKNNYLNNGYMIIGGLHVSLLDGKFVEDYIQIKFDFLGLASLEEIDKTLQFLDKTEGKEKRDRVHNIINTEALLYKDEETYIKIFQNKNSKKIFQFSSDGMQELTANVHPEQFEDLVAITALYRPGPMESGMTDMFVRNKKNPDSIFYEFKELEDILHLTYGTCLSGDSLITTKNGKNLTIKEIVEKNMIGEKVLSFNELNNKLEWKKITRTFNNGKKDLYEIRTKNGYSLKATNDHKFLTNNGWKELKDISKDDLLILPKKIYNNNNNNTFNKNKLLILAYLLSDGYLGKSHISFINKDEILLNSFKNAINEEFNNLKFNEYIKNNNVKEILVTSKERMSYNSNELINWIKELKLWNKSSSKKFIPNFIFNLNNDDIAFFLAKYWECDGHISKNGCHIKTISKDIKDSIQKLLLKLEIKSSIQESIYFDNNNRHKIAYSINISQYDFKIKLQNKLISFKKDVEIDRYTNNGIAPINKKDFINYLIPLLKNKNISQRQLVRDSGVSRSFLYSNNTNILFINTLLKLNKVLKDNFIEQLINNDVYYTEIKSINKNINDVVYDIEVEDNHNFFANNILVHNCVYQEQVMKIVQVLGGFSLGGADLVRRAMGKKIVEELQRLKGQFVDGTVDLYNGNHIELEVLQGLAKNHESVIWYDNGISLKSIKEINEMKVLTNELNDKNIGEIFFKDNQKVVFKEDEITRFLADNLFEYIIKFAGYGFNKSHAYAYTNVSMQMAYLKCHHPLEFFASIYFNNSDDVEKLSEYIIDGAKNNIPLLGPHINKSNLFFDIIQENKINTIIYGLSNIKGVTSKDIKKIIEDRNLNGEFKDLGDFLYRFIVKNNGSLKTLETLNNAGALDSLSINQNSMNKYIYFNTIEKINITEDKDIYLNRISNIKGYLNDLISSNIGNIFNIDESLSLQDKLVKIFDIKNQNILPFVIEKLLRTKESTSKKMFFDLTKEKLTKVKEQQSLFYFDDQLEENKEIETTNNELINKFGKNEIDKITKAKVKFINDLEEQLNIVENFKNELNYQDLDSIENKRTFIFKIILLSDVIQFNEKIIELINNKVDKFYSLREMSQREFEITGSMSNFGSLINRKDIYGDYQSIPALNLLKNPFENIDGTFKYKAVVKDIISGEKEDGDIYMNISLFDINNMETKFYLTKDQIFRYKNNLEIGDPIVLEVNISEGKDVFYKKLINIITFKEQYNWKNIEGFNKPLLSIKNLDQKKIREEYSQKIEFCKLTKIKSDWEKSSEQWPGLFSDVNKTVALILVSYKTIQSKKGKEFQVLEVTDGEGFETIELLYSNINIDLLENHKRKPIVVELSKKKENGYGISAVFGSEIIFLHDKFILPDNKKQDLYDILEADNVNELLDGIEHINVYSKGKTLLGRQLSNFANIPCVVEHNGKKIKFNTIEGYWYFLHIWLLTNESYYELMDLDGPAAKEYGRQIIREKELRELSNKQKLIFEKKIQNAIINKILNNKDLMLMMKKNTLPYLHYYNYGGKIVVPDDDDWFIKYINFLGKGLNQNKIS